MLPYFNKTAYGNPTLTHKPGWEAFEVIMNSFQKISKYIGAKILEEITFTPSETEANNLAIMGSCFAQKSKGQKNRYLRNRTNQRAPSCRDDGKIRFLNHQNPSRPRRLHQPRKTQRNSRQRNHFSQYFSSQQRTRNHPTHQRSCRHR